jgi:hypothetical protein
MSASQHQQFFDFNKCRAKMHGAGELVDCLVPAQACFCGRSLSFGNAYFCKHPMRSQFVERAAQSGSHSAGTMGRIGRRMGILTRLTIWIIRAPGHKSNPQKVQ